MIATNAALATIIHLKRRVKRKKSFKISAPLGKWEILELNKLKLYLNYIIKKAEIAPIR